MKNKSLERLFTILDRVEKSIDLVTTRDIEEKKNAYSKILIDFVFEWEEAVDGIGDKSGDYPVALGQFWLYDDTRKGLSGNLFRVVMVRGNVCGLLSMHTLDEIVIDQHELLRDGVYLGYQDGGM